MEGLNFDTTDIKSTINSLRLTELAIILNSVLHTCGWKSVPLQGKVLVCIQLSEVAFRKVQ
jgi:hypothetical protein